MKLIGTYPVGAMQAEPVIDAQVTPAVTLPRLTLVNTGMGTALGVAAHSPGKP